MMSSAVNENRFIPSFFFSSVSYAAITPFLALMIRDLGYSTILVGVLLGIFEGAGIAGPLVFGYCADKTKKYRLLLVVSCVIPALSAFPLALLIHPLASALLIASLAFGFKANTSLLDAATTIQIGTAGNYGRIRVWGSISFVLTLLWLQWTPFLKPVSAVNIAFWITLVSAASIIPVFILPLSKEKLSNKASPVNSDTPKIGMRKIITVYFAIGFILVFFSRFSMVGFYTYFPLYLTEEVQWNAVGLMFAIASMTEIPCMVFSRVIIRRFGSLPLLALAVFGVCVRLLLLAVFPFKPVIVAAQLLHSLCFGIFHPAAINFFTRVFPPEKRGLGMSVYLSLGMGLPTLIGNIVGGAIVHAAGFRFMFGVYSAISGVMVLVYFIFRKKANLTAITQP
ncbi:MAG: MFS transporter [Treponema sp.]|nr:MFS transporter [Treponema sp.]